MSEDEQRLTEQARQSQSETEDVREAGRQAAEELDEGGVAGKPPAGADDSKDAA